MMTPETGPLGSFRTAPMVWETPRPPASMKVSISMYLTTRFVESAVIVMLRESKPTLTSSDTLGMPRHKDFARVSVSITIRQDPLPFGGTDNNCNGLPRLRCAEAGLGAAIRRPTTKKCQLPIRATNDVMGL